MDAIEEVKSRLNIEDVVGEYVQLKRSGRNFKGLSPFTNEKSPSLMVSPEKQIWHDFSSGRGGNIFSFVMELEGLDFRGALELLARKAGVDLEAGRSGRGPSTKTKERLMGVLNDAANLYQRHLTKNNEALEYLRKKREFSKETIIEFRLGYSPKNNELTKFLLAKGYNEDELKAAGLTTIRRGGTSDMFRGRIMVPLMDSVGNVIGFTARLLGADDNGPKYINTPSTALYDKSRHIYGLSQAKQAIRTSNFVVVTEGNLDVISSHQAGVRQVVATAGTAMTPQHFSQLKRLTGDVRLSFDADRAGQAAAERAIPLAQAAEVNLSIITLPEGKDPDELVRKDAKLWAETINKPTYALDWLMGQYQLTLDMNSSVGKRRFTDVILAVVRKLQDPVEQDHYLSELAKISGSSREALKSKLAHESRQTRLRKPTNQPANSSLPDYEKRLQHFLGIMLLFPKLRGLLEDLPEDIFYGEAAEVAKVLRDHGSQKSKDLSVNLKESADYVKMLALLAEEGYGRTEAEELKYQTLGLRARLVAEYVKLKRNIISKNLVEQGADQDTLLAEVKKLDELQTKFQIN
ncbi:MAG: DNA primase [bacterium]|nr:DNA primase [bacterium]